MARKKEIVDEEQEEDVEWDKKKIGITLGILVIGIILGVLLRNYILAYTNPVATPPPQAVKGASISVPDFSHPQSLLPSQNDVNNEVQSLKNQVQSISTTQIASSSPQVQALIQQIQNLPNVPGNIAKQTCEQICSGL